MYYPFLRGKQFELIAIRELAPLLKKKSNIIPIFEPVKASFSSFNKSLKILCENGIKFAVVLNPQVGELSEKRNKVDIICSSVEYSIRSSNCFIPVLYLNGNDQEASPSSVLDVINRLEIIPALIASNLTDADDPSIDKILSKNPPFVILENGNRRLKRKIKDKGIPLSSLKDSFISRKRNRDYLLNENELFSEDPYFYASDDYDGFSDYALLPKDYSDGGRLPYAVAIHLTYPTGNEQIFVYHAVSNTNDDQSNIQLKFMEAAQKAIALVENKKLKTQATEELKRYLDEGTYPGLGVIKKISLKHHIELIMQEIA